ncbi:hypothetical protein H4R19_002984 [Coemansia spiralis]|nr:hypothetical protein H4R19_002984 [Coemansia spiralis]
MTAPEPQLCDAVYEITPADSNMASRVNLQFVLVYQTPQNLRPHMAARLREAFYRTMARYPIFYGRIEACSAESSLAVARVVVSSCVPEECIPRYEDVDTDVRVEDIRAAHFNWSTWPPALLSVCPVRRAAVEGQPDDPLVHCVVTWHADGMCIMISIDHLVADGIGVDIVLDQWAQAVREPQTVSDAEGDSDHMSMYDSIRQCTPEADWFVRHVDAVDITSVKAPSEAALVTDPRSPQEVELSLRNNVHSVRMTPDAMELLRHDALQECGVASEDCRVSLIRVVYALMWQRYMVAVQEDAVPDAAPSLFNIVHSGRYLVNRPQYIGNCVCPVYMTHTMGELKRMPLYRLAEEIDKHMFDVSRPRWMALMLLLQDPERYAKFITVFANPNSHQLTVSNLSQSGMLGADFGFGSPAHATVYPALIPGFAVWVPLTAAGGLHILWNMTPAVATRLQNDPVFTRYAELLF